MRSPHTWVKPYLHKRVVLFVVALDGKNRIAWSTCANIHLDHLAVEEVSEVLLVDIRGNAADVEAARLSRQVRISSNTHAEALNRHGGR